MKISARASILVLSAFVSAATALAGPAPDFKTDKNLQLIEPAPPRYLNDFNLTTSYVFESEIDGEPGFGDQDAYHVAARYARRIPLDGLALPKLRDEGYWALSLGAAYNRFDFSSTSGPLPTTLQSVAGIIGLEYKVGCYTGFILQSRPGVYFGDEIDSGSFDIPTDIGFPIALGNLKDARGEDRLYLVVGASFSLLRSYTVLPVLGVYWQINDQWALNATLPEPRLTYSAPGGNLRFFVGGQLTGGSFKTNIENANPSKLDDAVVTYSEYRAGGGITFQPCPQLKCVEVELAGGWAFEREFDFHRADREYSAEGAPYVKFEIRAQF